MGEMRNKYKILVGKTVVNKPLGRPSCRLLFNIKMDLKEICVEVWTGSRIGTNSDLY
jgi:hypothetical protein